MKNNLQNFGKCLSIVSGIVIVLLFTSFRPASEDLTVDILKHTNQFRKSKGLPELKMEKDLNEIAEKHSKDMAKGRVGFGHAGFDERHSKAQKVIRPFSGMAENVAYGANDGREVVTLWKNSTGHRKNMLGNYKYIGIGHAKNQQGVIYYTQVFVR